MKQIRPILALMPLLFISADLVAASLIETKREDSTDLMYVDGYRMLIQDAEATYRMIMDLERKKAYMVNRENKTAMDMSEATWKALEAAGEKKAPPTVDARLEKVGDGPEIAGYETTHYRIYVDGQVCAEKWTSRQALKDSGFGEIWDEHGEFLLSASIDANAHPCELAEYQVFRDDKFGMALKETDHNCETNEVLRIERNVEFNRSELELPADYKVVKMPSYSGSTVQGHLQEDGTWSWGTWEGMDCTNRDDEYAGMHGRYMDDEYLDEEYADEEYADEEYADEEYSEETFSIEDMAAEISEEEAEDLGDEVKSKFKGFMNKFKKNDKNQDDGG